MAHLSDPLMDADLGDRLEKQAENGLNIRAKRAGKKSIKAIIRNCIKSTKFNTKN